MEDLLDLTSKLKVVDEDGWEVCENREMEEVIDIQKEDVMKIAYNEYFWFKVWISIEKPICPGYLFPCSGNRIWLPFRYERLPYMCFNCGRVGHDHRSCAKSPEQIDLGDGKKTAAYGAWLKFEENPSRGKERNSNRNDYGSSLEQNKNSNQAIDSLEAEERMKVNSLDHLILNFGNSRGKMPERLPRINNRNSTINQVPTPNSLLYTGKRDLNIKGKDKLMETQTPGDGGVVNKKRSGNWDSLIQEDDLSMQPGKRLHMDDSNLMMGPKQGIHMEEGDWIDIPINFAKDIGEGSSGPKGGKKQKRGLGNPWTLKTLSSHVKDHHPGMIFLSKTKLKEEAMERIRIVLGYDGCFVVAAKGKSGGLALLWKDPSEVSVKSYTVSHIDAVIENGLGFEWRFIGFYGSPDPRGRKNSWQLLERLRDLRRGAWLCGGNFNEILKANEKKGGGVKMDSQMKEFQQAISYCNFKELWMDGGEYTWCNGRHNNLVFEKLDRVMANPDWFNKIWASKVTLLLWWNSDHRPLMININKDQQHSNKEFKWRSRFHYEQAWAEDEECSKIVDSTWLDVSYWGSTIGLRGRLNQCGEKLNEWNKDKKTELGAKTKKLKEDLKKKYPLRMER
uniref:CCHC-type domain-containing protein n=1 Tax=Cannabis sativa TaxID=3483 RepID=A0A803Q7L2_CANSA